MASFQSQVMRWYLQWIRFVRSNEALELERERQRFDSYGEFIKVPAGIEIQTIGANGVPCEWIIPENAQEKKIFYFVHGGGFLMGSNTAYRGLMSYIAKHSKMKLLAVEYALAPEQPFPMGLSQVLLVYEWLLKEYPDHQIVIGGDSAGGNLVLSTLQKAKEEQIKMPHKCVLIAPWVDLTLQCDSINRLADEDLILSKERLEAAATVYAGDNEKSNPYISPLFADFKGFPPTLIQLGTYDILLDEGKLLADKMQDAGVEVTLKIWEKMLHVWHIVGKQIPEAPQAVREIGAYVNS